MTPLPRHFPPPLETSDLEELIHGIFTDVGAARTVPPEWLIEGLIPTGIVFIGGPPKSRKSAVAATIATMVAQYPAEVFPEHLRKVDRTGRVVIFSAEASAGEIRYTIEKGMGIKLKDDRSILVVDDPWQWRLDDPEALVRLFRWLDVIDPVLLIIDPLRDFHSVEEKDDGEMNRLLRPIQQWAKKKKACAMVVHHTAKKQGGDSSHFKASEMRGTGAIFGIADGVVMVTPKKDGSFYFEVTVKRGESWEGAINLNLWRTSESSLTKRRARSTSESAASSLSNMAKKVLKAYRGGARSTEDARKWCRTSKTKVVEANKELREAKLVRLVKDPQGRTRIQPTVKRAAAA